MYNAVDEIMKGIDSKKRPLKKRGDKGISAGEGSKIRASRIIIKNGEIAFASKDNSFLEINNAILENNKLGFTAFQKKPEFGPGEIIADSIEIKNCELNYLIENNSSLILNGEKSGDGGGGEGQDVWSGVWEE